MIEKARDVFFPYAEECTQTALVGLAFTDGACAVQTNTACHASMCYGFEQMKKAVTNDFVTKGHPSVVFSAVVNKGELDKNQFLSFAKYMLEESPYQKVFLNKSPEDVWERHWVLSLEQCADLTGGAAIATRLPTEFPRNFEVFIDLYRAGFGGAKAHYWAHKLGKNVDYYWADLSGHAPIDGYSRSKKYYNNFISSTPVRTQRSFLELGQYGRIHNLWGPMLPATPTCPHILFPQRFRLVLR